MTIEESNILIARFMGAELDGEDWHISGRDMTVNNRRYPGNLKYHSSWEWLMRVVEKINNLKVGDMWFRTIIGPAQCTISIYAHGGMSVPVRHPRFHVGAKEKMIEATYEAVIQFIQWYNTQNTQQ